MSYSKTIHSVSEETWWLSLNRSAGRVVLWTALCGPGQGSHFLTQFPSVNNFVDYFLAQAAKPGIWRLKIFEWKMYQRPHHRLDQTEETIASWKTGLWNTWMRENERMRKRNTCGSYHDANPHTGSEIHKQQRRGKRGKHPALGRGIHKLPRFQIDSVLFEYDGNKKRWLHWQVQVKCSLYSDG